MNQGEAFLTSDDEPAQFNEDSAALLNQKIDDHKQFFENYERTMEQLKQWTSKAGPDVPAEQLQSLVKRFVYIFYSARFLILIFSFYIPKNIFSCKTPRKKLELILNNYKSYSGIYFSNNIKTINIWPLKVFFLFTHT